MSALYGLQLPSLHSAAILPEFRLPILPNDPMAVNPLKLLLPSLRLTAFLGLLGLEGLASISVLLWVMAFDFATTSWVMLLLQKGHTGAAAVEDVAGFGFLWQHMASMQWAHIWWPHCLTSIVHAWSKHMQHISTSLSCLRIYQSTKIRKMHNLFTCSLLSPSIVMFLLSVIKIVPIHGTMSDMQHIQVSGLKYVKILINLLKSV